MIYRNLSVYWIQETWLDGNFIKEIEGYTIFHHGLEKQVCKRGQNRVAVILSLECTIFYNKSGSKPQVNPKISSSVEFGRFLDLKLSIIVKIVLKGAFQKKKKKFSTRKNLNLKLTNHNTIKTQYFAQIQDRTNKTKNNKTSGTTKSLRNNNGPKIKNKSQTIH